MTARELGLNINPALKSVALRSYPVYIDCNNGGCAYSGHSQTTSEVNILNALGCFFCSACWTVLIMFQKKDFTVYNVTHHCPQCSGLQGIYTPHDL